MHDSWRTWQAYAADAGRGRPGVLDPILEAVERFDAAARRYLDETAASSGTAAGAGAAARKFSHFLREQAARLWPPPWAFGTVADGPAAVTPPEPFAEPPAIGVTREHQQRMHRSAAAERRVADARSRLQWLWFDTLAAAADAFCARLAAGSGATTEPPTLRGLYDTWIDCAEAAYAETVHGEAFCAALADCVNAGSAWRAEAAAGLELSAKLWDLPTRSELDSLNRRLVAMERQVRADHAQPNRTRPARRGPRRPKR